MNNELSEKLFWASLDGKADEVLQLLAQGADVKYKRPLLKEAIGAGIASGIGAYAAGYGAFCGAEVVATAGLSAGGAYGLALGIGSIIYMPVLVGLAAGATLGYGGLYAVEYYSLRHATPLHAAAYGGHVSVVQILLDHGADALAKDGNGKTPFEVVCNRNNVSQNQKATILALLRRSVVGGDATILIAGVVIVEGR